MSLRILLLAVLSLSAHAESQPELYGRVLDPQGIAVPDCRVSIAGTTLQARTGRDGTFRIAGLTPGPQELRVDAAGFEPVYRGIRITAGTVLHIDLKLGAVTAAQDSVVVYGKTLEPTIDLLNTEVFERTLFTRDDQVLQQLNSGINAGQHEGGGKSLEIRRFGFNLDHGGVNGGLKVMVDDVQQNQGTQGHGQGYLGSLKALSPELIQDVTVINGPFSAEYGDFSGLGVVHIRQRETLPDTLTLRVQGGNFNTARGFIGYSPTIKNVDSYVAYEGSYTDGPFENPGRYRRDNINGNLTRHFGDHDSVGLRFLLGRNNFYSSGQLPLDLIETGQLDRFGYLDPTHGGSVKMGTVSAWYTRSNHDGASFRLDGFVSRSLFDLFSNFTYFRDNPETGDAFQQHDSRLQEGVNAHYSRPHRLFGISAMLTGGANFHDNQINVGMYPRMGRAPTGVTSRANAHVTNGAGYAQESVSLWSGRLLAGGGIRYDGFRFDVTDRVNPQSGGVQGAGQWQGKGNVALTPAKRLPMTLHLNYGRGINSSDARGIVQRPDAPRVATTDFYQTGISSRLSRVSVTADLFLIDHSNEQVYIPDDGTFEFKGRTRAYGFETKTSVALTRRVSINAGLTKISNAFYQGGDYRVYVDSAPHFVANAALTLTAWRGWSASVRMRAINHYRLDGEDPTIRAAGHTIFDFGMSRRIRRGVEFNLAIDNMTNRDYYETQNYFDSRVTPTAPVLYRIHATPGYPLNAVAGLTFRFGGK